MLVGTQAKSPLLFTYIDFDSTSSYCKGISIGNLFADRQVWNQADSTGLLHCKPNSSGYTKK
jgi:hypothetical protein